LKVGVVGVFFPETVVGCAFLKVLISLYSFVTPAQAGVQGHSDKLLKNLDSGLRRNDEGRLRKPPKR
jgi:hypothetical protein